MTKIIRNVEESAKQSYDMVIVGGGIYGVMLALEAVRKNLRPILLEKNDFSHATSLNHLRTVHGGLRYLQSLDLLRFRESVGERKWFLRYFPQFVNQMPCLMPLYGKGLHRNMILRMGLLLNDILSFNRNNSVDKDKHLPGGEIVSPTDSQKIFPKVDMDGLTGGALWYDAGVPEFQRLLVEILKLTVASGAILLNYVEVSKLLTDNNKVTGVQATDRETGMEYRFNAPIVMNAAGPHSRDLAKTFDRDHFPLFRKRLLLWNVLFNKEALSDHALGLSTVKGGGHTYFFHPWKNRLLVGTGEIVVDQNDQETMVPDKAMEAFINDINTVVPGLGLTEHNIQRVYSGILPANDEGRLANREVIYNHSINGGPVGLYSISGVKFTTSRLVAEKTLEPIFPNREKISYDKLLTRMDKGNLSFDYDWEPHSDEDLAILKTIVADEAVMHLSDLVLRRTSLGDHPERAKRILPKLRPLFDWNEEKWQKEVNDLYALLNPNGRPVE